MQGKRVVVFVIGGMSRSELRVAHVLSAKLGRDIILGSTSVETPTTFLNRLKVGAWLCHPAIPSSMAALV